MKRKREERVSEKIFSGWLKLLLLEDEVENIDLVLDYDNDYDELEDFYWNWKGRGELNLH